MGSDDWGEVVTRYPYRKVRLDHLLSTRIKTDENVTGNSSLFSVFSFEGTIRRVMDSQRVP